MIDEQARDRAEKVMEVMLDQRRQVHLAGGKPAAVLMSDEDHDHIAAMFAHDMGLDEVVPVEKAYGMDVGRFAGWPAGKIVVTERIGQADITPLESPT